MFTVDQTALFTDITIKQYVAPISDDVEGDED